jgi:hypothetical protein
VEIRPLLYFSILSKDRHNNGIKKDRHNNGMKNKDIHNNGIKKRDIHNNGMKKKDIHNNGMKKKDRRSCLISTFILESQNEMYSSQYDACRYMNVLLKTDNRDVEQQ